MYLQTATRATPAKLPPFAAKPAAGEGSAVAFLKSIASVQKFCPGQTLFAEGDDASDVFEIVQGIVKLYKLLPDGRRQIVGFVSQQHLVGFDDDDIYLYTAEAVTEVSVSRWRRGQFDRLIDEQPGLARRLLSARCRDLHTAQDQMLLLGRKTALERIASFLLTLSEMQSTARRDGGIEVPMTRCDIADYLGLTIETVSRSLSRLRRDNIIRLPTATHIEVIDADRLEELAGGETLEAA
jgi:CRP/FNR family transcriptional regulator